MTAEHTQQDQSVPKPLVLSTRRSSTLRFVVHYVEMVLVMVGGMVVLGLPLALLAAALGSGPGELERDAPALLLAGMGISMTVPMVGWMWWRGHSWGATREMAAAMIVPTLAALALLAAGVDDVGALLGLQHVAMFPAMLVAMLVHREEYTHGGDR
jgi:hypothetical protein